MMLLTSLPTEILTQIFECLIFPHEHHHHLSTLYALTLTCRRIGDIAQPVLLRKIFFWIEEDNEDCQRVQRFLRSCSEHPHHFGQIRAAKIWWKTWKSMSVCEDAIMRLGESNSLRELELRHLRADMYKDMPHMLSRKALFRNLEHLTLGIDTTNSRCIDTNVFFELCMLPRLTRITVHGPIAPPNVRQKPMTDYEFTDGAHPDSLVFSTSNLEEINCTGEILHEDVLRFVLPRTPKLVKLSIPPVYIDDEEVPLIRTWNMKNRLPHHTIFSPAKLGKLLKPVRSTLQYLKIRDFDEQTKHPDSTRLDLSRFHNLHTLDTAESYLFDSTMHSIGHAVGFHQLLPRNIQNVRITFVRTRGLLYRWPSMLATYEEGHESWTSYWRTMSSGLHANTFSNLPCIAEIMDRKDAVFPNLKRLDLHELRIWGRRSSAVSVGTLQPDQSFSKYLASKGVSITVWLRIPSSWSTPLPRVYDPSPLLDIYQMPDD